MVSTNLLVNLVIMALFVAMILMFYQFKNSSDELVRLYEESNCSAFISGYLDTLRFNLTDLQIPKTPLINGTP